MDLEQLGGTFQSADWITEFADKVCTEAPSRLAHADCDFLVRQVKTQLGKGRVGRARNWVALGLYIDAANAMAYFKRAGLFRASKFGFKGESLLRIVATVLEASDALGLDSDTRRYLESQRSLLTLAAGARRLYVSVVRELRKRRRIALKSLVVTVDRMFLVPYRADIGLDCDDPRQYAMEDHAEALSFLVHTLATIQPIEDRQFDVIDEQGIQEGVYEDLLVAACKLRVYQEAELLVDVFHYSASGDGDAINLRPNEPRLEQSIRLGYIHTEHQKLLSLQRDFEEGGEPVASLEELSKQVYNQFGAKMVRRRERPFPRYALFFPEADELFEPFRATGLYKEDVVYLDAVAREQYVRPQAVLAFPLADGLTLLDVVKIRRFLNFLRELMAQKLLPLMEGDPQLVNRSLLPVFRKDKLLHLLGKCVSEEAAQAFLDIATYDRESSVGVFDVQYQPLIVGVDHYLVPMNILCSSDLLRNLLFKQRKKVQDIDAVSPVQRVVAAALRKRFGQVAEGVKLRVHGASLEMDVVAVVQRRLLVIECKSPFHPCGLHELRTSYEHLLKARKQLDRLREALRDEEVRRRLCVNQKWDSGAVDDVLTCVVTGNRLFNGYVVGDHPVRPAYEMVNMLVRGTIQLGDEDFGVWRRPDFEPEDLLDYLAGSTIHADLARSFLEAARSYELGGATMNVWTYVLDGGELLQTSRARYRRVTGNEGEEA